MVLGSVGLLSATPPARWPGWYALASALGLATMAAASLLWTVSPSLTVEALPGWLFAAISLGFIAWSCRGPRLALVALLAVILVSVVAASVVTVQLFIGEIQLFASGRLSYPIRYANGTAALILIGLPAVVGLVAGAPAQLALRGMLTGVGGLLLATGSLALSRSSALGLAAAGAVLVLATRPRRAAVLTVIALSLALVAASPLLFQSSNSPAHRGTGVVLVVVLAALCGVVLAGLEPSLAKALRGKTGRFAATGVAVVVAASVVGIALARLGNPWDASVRAWNEFRAVPRTAPAIETTARFKSARATGTITGALPTVHGKKTRSSEPEPAHFPSRGTESAVPRRPSPIRTAGPSRSAPNSGWWE